jgi:adenine-specific DNA-methyltransferase
LGRGAVELQQSKWQIAPNEVDFFVRFLFRCGVNEIVSSQRAKTAHPVAARALAHFDALFPVDEDALVLKPPIVALDQPNSLESSEFRYSQVDQKKANGVTYTPKELADFISSRMFQHFDFSGRTELTILDPAVGDGALCHSLLEKVVQKFSGRIHLTIFDTDAASLESARSQIAGDYPDVIIDARNSDFIDYITGFEDRNSLFFNESMAKFDAIIANPPYVRTQIMGAAKAQQLSAAFGLAGRVDLYQAFMLGLTRALDAHGVIGIIVSNRFMTIKGGSALRAALRVQCALKEIWDLGDTKIFDAAVLPAIVVANGIGCQNQAEPRFSLIYETTEQADVTVSTAIKALANSGTVELHDGRKFCVKHGYLDASGKADGVWRIATASGDAWLATVAKNSWKKFGDIGKIRVGVKTCADKIFIRHDWGEETAGNLPELLRPLTTHFGAGRFRATVPKKERSIFYPHQSVEGQRQAIDIDLFPNSAAYISKHREALEKRTYVIEAGRKYYELWVPQDPAAWALPKLVFRDISERPTFWMDKSGSVVNGDCYWLATFDQANEQLLWLAAAVANSTFAESYYDRCFNNKLYSGRRRFITQYVEQFPLPDPETSIAKQIVSVAMAIYDENHSSKVEAMERDMDQLVWKAFGLAVEEVGR